MPVLRKQKKKQPKTKTKKEEKKDLHLEKYDIQNQYINFCFK